MVGSEKDSFDSKVCSLQKQKQTIVGHVITSICRLHIESVVSSTWSLTVGNTSADEAHGLHCSSGSTQVRVLE